ncbi:MAG: hypothetical protein GXY44_08165 [Phycisphaerales bacterium]|nr:hypothetical protein [Phycisphaerales bacterium]
MSNHAEESKQFSTNPKVEQHRAMLLDAKKKGSLATLGVFARLSGPGWLQSALTLGGGSLSSAMYLGVLVGFSFMWLQPLAMILGVVMLSAIAYVTLSTGRRPLRDINRHVSPVLGWGWLIASMMANIVWSMPQFMLGMAGMQQNLFPGLFGPNGIFPPPYGQLIPAMLILIITVTVVMLYIQGSWGVKVFEILVKCMVGAIVICFFGVVFKLTSKGVLDWGNIWAGFIPDFSLFSQPTHSIRPLIAQVAEQYRSFWSDMLVSQQRDVMISAAATAVGINMTFLLPYSMLRKGWDKEFRGLAIFDLSTGLFIPFILATGCVVIASASQFHAKPAEGFGFTDAERAGDVLQPADNLVKPYYTLLEDRWLFQIEADGQAAESIAREKDEFRKLPVEERKAITAQLPEADRFMAAVLVKRDAFNLANTLAPLTGENIAKYLFGFGVLAMALNAATMLMLINGLCFCELLNRPARGWTQRIGSLMVCVGLITPFYWKDAMMWVAMPTSVFAFCLLPIAYFAFYWLMNQRKVLGDRMPKGGKRVLWNVLMGIACMAASIGSLWSLWLKLQWWGIGLFGMFLTLVFVVHLLRAPDQHPPAPTAENH